MNKSHLPVYLLCAAVLGLLGGAVAVAGTHSSHADYKSMSEQVSAHCHITANQVPVDHFKLTVGSAFVKTTAYEFAPVSGTPGDNALFLKGGGEEMLCAGDTFKDGDSFSGWDGTKIQPCADTVLGNCSGGGPAEPAPQLQQYLNNQ